MTTIFPVNDQMRMEVDDSGTYTALHIEGQRLQFATGEDLVTTTTDPTTGMVELVIPGAINVPVVGTYTWAQMQALTGVTAGTRAICSDLNYAEFVYSGGFWMSPNPIQLQPSGGVPFIVPSSGTIGNNGALSGITALPRIYPKCYMYFPENAVYAGSPSAWFYTVMSSTTAGTIYNNAITASYATITGSTLAPTIPVAFSTTGPGAYTQSFSNLPIIAWEVPASLLGLHGSLELQYQVTVPNNGNGKKISLYMDGGVQIENNTITSAGGGNFRYLVTNQGVQNKQAMQDNNYDGYGAGGGRIYDAAANFAVAQKVELTGNLGTPTTDYLILETYRASVKTGF